MKRILSLLLIIVLCFTLNPSVASAAVKISKTKVTLDVGKTVTLKISGTSKAVKWTSSDKEVAAVSKGKVTAHEAGTSTITATVNKKKYTCEITVFPKIYEDGKYLVGTDIASGEYVIFTGDNGSIGYFNLWSDGNEKKSIVDEIFDYNSIMYIEDGEYLELSNAYAVEIGDVSKLNTDGTGMFKIGTYMDAGEYNLTVDIDYAGYYCIYSDNRHKDIVANKSFIIGARVTVEDGQYLTLVGCKIKK